MADAQAAAAAAVALALANTNKARLTLRPVEGREDAADARDCIAKVEAYRIVARLTELETVQAIQFTCVPGSVAATWLSTLVEEEPSKWKTGPPCGHTSPPSSHQRGHHHRGRHWWKSAGSTRQSP